MPAVGAFNSYRPTLDIYGSKYQLRCDDGTLKGEFSGSIVNYNDFYSFDDTSKIGARLACTYPTLSKEELLKIVLAGDSGVSKTKNYTIIMKQPHHNGSWTAAIFGSLGALIATIFFFSLIRAIFFYISVSRPFWKTIVFR